MLIEPNSELSFSSFNVFSFFCRTMEQIQGSEWTGRLPVSQCMVVAALICYLHLKIRRHLWVCKKACVRPPKNMEEGALGRWDLQWHFQPAFDQPKNSIMLQGCFSTAVSAKMVWGWGKWSNFPLWDGQKSHWQDVASSYRNLFQTPVATTAEKRWLDKLLTLEGWIDRRMPI